MALSKNIEIWTDYDRQGQWTLLIKKKRGKLSLDEIQEACMSWGEDFYMLVIAAFDQDVGQYFDLDDLQGDFVTLYRADDFFRWREKDNK